MIFKIISIAVILIDILMFTGVALKNEDIVNVIIAIVLVMVHTFPLITLLT